MASNYRTTFVQNLAISETTTGLFDAQGNALATANIVENGNWAYSRTITLNGDTDDYVLTALCESCTIDVILEMSPDGVNWCECDLSSGNTCQVTCTAASGDCVTQAIDVALLPFVRIKIGQASESGGTCTVSLYHELEEQADSGSIESGKADDTIEQEVVFTGTTPKQNEKVS